MSTTLIEVRPAKAADATAVACTHDEAWRSAYQGIIPGAELEKLINRRGPQWWDSAIRKGSRVSVLVFGDKPEDREAVIKLAEALGVRGLHAGPLANSAAAEALTSVIIGINRTFKVDGASIRITGFAPKA